MTTIVVRANLQLIAPQGPFNGVWVRLASDFDGSTYVAAAVSDSAGNFTVAGVPAGPAYQVQTSDPAHGGSSSGPWTSQNQAFTPGMNAMGTFAVSLTPAALPAAIGFSEQTFTVNGLQIGDVVSISPPAAPASLASAVLARVSAANTLAITFANLAATAQTPIAGTYLVTITRT